MSKQTKADGFAALSLNCRRSLPRRRGGWCALGSLTSVSALMTALSLSMAGGAAHAATDTQTAGAGDAGGLEEVVVTARYRSESVQKSPLSITVLTSDDLEAQGVRAVTDIAQSVPNVTMLPAGAGYGKSAIAFIRGVGQNDFNFAYEPGVGMYVDDIYYSTLFGSEFTLGDVGRVEVLRGPQGTLFGKNSEGGAIRIYSVQPSGDDSGYAEAGYGSYNHQMFRGAFDATLVPGKFFVRVSGGVDKADGYVSLYDYACRYPGASGSLKLTTNNGCKTGTEGSVDTVTGRIAARWLVNDDLTVDLSADVTRDGGTSSPDVALQINPSYPGAGTANYNTYVAVPYYGIPIDSHFVTSSAYSSYATFIDQRSGISIPNVNSANSWGAQGKITWNAPGDLLVTSITGYRANDGAFSDNKGGPIPIELVYNLVKHHQISEELRVEGKALGDALEWTLGGYYFSGYSWNGGEVDVPGAQIIPPGVLPPFPTGVYGINFKLNDPVNSENLSGFAHAIYHFNDKLSMEVGARYSYDTKTYTFYRYLLPLTPANPIFVPGTFLFPITSETSTSYRFDPKIGLQYQWTPELMTYAQFSTGYKGGGINPRPAAADQVRPFGPESLEAYEIGIKSQWFDNRLRANAAAFVNDYQEMQLVGVTGGGVATTMTMNAGGALVKGLEFEGEAEPLPGLLFDLSAGYLDFQYQSLGAAAYDPITNPNGIFKNDVPPEVPKFKINIGAQYTFNMDQYGTLTPRADWTYQSKVYFDVQNTPSTSQDGYGVLNLRLAYGTPDGKWTAALEVENATDKQYYLTKFNLLGAYGVLYGQPAMPRTAFFSIKRTF